MVFNSAWSPIIKTTGFVIVKTKDLLIDRQSLIGVTCIDDAAAVTYKSPCSTWMHPGSE
jgi:hypothetical protein